MTVLHETKIDWVIKLTMDFFQANGNMKQGLQN